jgi:hypothetical protein
MVKARSVFGASLTAAGDLERARRVLGDALASVPADAWREKWFVAADIADELGRVEVALGDPAAGLKHCLLARDTTERDHRVLAVQTCIAEALLAMDDAAGALRELEPPVAPLEDADAIQVADYRFVYARALWQGRRDAKRARALVAQARAGATPTTRARVDAWVASLPR